MSVSLHFTRDRPAVTDLDDTGIFFARFHQSVRAGRREFFQLAPRVFVRAVLAPHHRENSQLSEIRFAPKNFSDAVKFFRRKSMLFDEFRRNHRIGIRLFAAHRYSTLTHPKHPSSSPDASDALTC